MTYAKPTAKRAPLVALMQSPSWCEPGWVCYPEKKEV